MADGNLVATPESPSADLIPDLLTLSDVMGTGWYAAECARVQPGMTVAVVGDGAVGLCGVLAAAQMGAERIIAMSRHASRQGLVEAGALQVIEPDFRHAPASSCAISLRMAATLSGWVSIAT